MFTHKKILIMMITIAGLLACGSEDPDKTLDVGRNDVGSDTGSDSSNDTGSDAGMDVANDTPGDTATDTPTDSSTDVPPDAPPTPNYAFVTSMTTTPGELANVSGASDGLDGADILCNEAAAAASLPGKYVAWLSTGSVDAFDRLASARGWMRTDGVPFADQHTMFATGAHWVPLNRDENGKAVAELVFTGTLSSGLATAATCSDWTSTTGSTVGASSGEMGHAWTSSKVPQCSGSYRLYCFGIDKNVPTTPQQATGRLAFVSEQVLEPGPGVGIDEADGICASEASDASLSGTFKALLAADGSSAISRFNMGGDMWVRTDGIPFGSIANLLAGNLKTAIHVHADGKSYSTSGNVFSGANNPNVDGTTQGTCGDWLSKLRQRPRRLATRPGIGVCGLSNRAARTARSSTVFKSESIANRSLRKRRERCLRFLSA